MNKIPPWATTIITAICGVALIWIANGVQDDVRDMRAKMDVLMPAVAVHTSMFSNHEAILIDLKNRIERLEAKQ